MVTLVNGQTLPPIRRPGAISDRRRLVEKTLRSGGVATGTARSYTAARTEVKRLRYHAGQLGARLTARYEEIGTVVRWYVMVSPKEGQQQ